MSLHWLPVEFRSQYKLLLYVYKALNDLAPLYLKELVTPYKPARSLCSESAFLLQVPKTRTKTYGEHRFDKAVATLWNALPSNLRLAKSVDIFKHGLKLICTDKLLIHDLSYLILCVYNYDIYRVLRNFSQTHAYNYILSTRYFTLCEHFLVKDTFLILC